MQQETVAPEIPKFWRRPLDEGQVQSPVGEVMILEERCKGCQWCVAFCPREVLQMSQKFNSKGYHPPEVVKTGLCVDCRLCELMCPDFAIFLKRPPAEEASDDNG